MVLTIRRGPYHSAFPVWAFGRASHGVQAGVSELWLPVPSSQRHDVLPAVQVPAAAVGHPDCCGRYFIGALIALIVIAAASGR